MPTLTDSLIVVPLENKVLLPSVVLKINMKGRDAVSLARKHLRFSEQRKPTYVACIPLTGESTAVVEEDAVALKEEGFVKAEDKDRLFAYGCTARIVRVQRSGLGAFTMFVEGISRFGVDEYFTQDNALHVKVKYFDEELENETSDEMIRFKALVREFLAKMKDLNMPENLIGQLTKLIDSVSPPVLADLLVSVIETSFDEKLTMLATISLKERVEKASEWMTRQLHVSYYRNIFFGLLFNAIFFLFKKRC